LLPEKCQKWGFIFYYLFMNVNKQDIHILLKPWRSRKSHHRGVVKTRVEKARAMVVIMGARQHHLTLGRTQANAKADSRNRKRWEV
jgi:hypothetical protein